MRAIGTLQINEIRFDLSNSISEFVPLLDESELNGCMLLGTAWVIQRKINDKALPSDQPAAALSQLHYLE
jgi:hypothetical protein